MNDAPQSPANTAPEPNKPKALKSPAVSSASTQDKSQMMESNPEFKKPRDQSLIWMTLRLSNTVNLMKESKNLSGKRMNRSLSDSFQVMTSPRGELKIFMDTQNTRELILDLEDEVMFTLLDGGFEEELLNHGLSIGLSGSQINDYAQLQKDPRFD